MDVFLCSWCGKYSYHSKNQARDAMIRNKKRMGYSYDGTVYRCDSNRKIFHFTHKSNKESHKYRDYLRRIKYRDDPILVSANPKSFPVTHTSQWRWIMFDALARFGVRASKTIKLTPDQWTGTVNHSYWAAPATVLLTIRKRKRNEE